MVCSVCGPKGCRIVESGCWRREVQTGLCGCGVAPAHMSVSQKGGRHRRLRHGVVLKVLASRPLVRLHRDWRVFP